MSPKHGTRLSKETHINKIKLTVNFFYRKGEKSKLDHLTAHITALQLMSKKEDLRRNCLCGLATWKSRQGAGFLLGRLWDIYTTEPGALSHKWQGAKSHSCDQGSWTMNEFGSQTHRAGLCAVPRTSHLCWSQWSKLKVVGEQQRTLIVLGAIQEEPWCSQRMCTQHSEKHFCCASVLLFTVKHKQVSVWLQVFVGNCRSNHFQAVCTNLALLGWRKKEA